MAQHGARARNFQVSDLRFSRAFIRALGLIKKAAAQVNIDLGLLSRELGVPMIQAAQAVSEGKFDDQFILDIFQTGSGTSTNMNANEVIAGIANESLTGVRGGRKPVHPNDHVNMGQSSNDVIPTAIHLAALDRLYNALKPALIDLQTRLSERANAFDRVVKVGRTHLQDAVPIRLGQELSGYAAQVQQAVHRLQHGSATLLELPIGGTALGTGINTHHEFPERMAAALGRETGLAVRPASNTFECMAQRDAAVEASGILKTVAISLSCVANNLRLLGCGPRCGIGEIRIPELQPGSSIMPGKVNPVIPEAVMMVAAQVIGNDATIAWANALGSSFQLNVMMPIIAFNLLQSIDLLSTGANHLATKCIDATEFLQDQQAEGVLRVEADEARCRLLVEKSLAMCTALATRIGYDMASAIAKTAYHENLEVRELASELAGLDPQGMATRLGDPGLASAIQEKGGFPSIEEVEQLLDPYSQTIRGTGSQGGTTG